MDPNLSTINNPNNIHDPNDFYHDHTIEMPRVGSKADIEIELNRSGGLIYP